MGIQGGSLISLCTLLAWACAFSDVIISMVVPEGEIAKAAIDGNCWIYECSCGIVAGLEKGTAESFAKLVANYKKRVAYVRECGWKPIIVFDGRSMPIKKATNDQRAARRRKAKRKRTGNTRRGRSDLSSFKVTHDLIHRLVLALREAGETVLVAPHEGDPQCAYLVNSGKAHIVITRDSDLIAHGCKCIFFWNSLYHKGGPGGYGGKFYFRPQLWRCSSGLWKPIIKLGWDAFLAVCVISGTDYNVGVKNIAIKKAVKLLTEYHTLEAVVKELEDPERRLYRNAKVPTNFLADAHKAMLMFKHAIVFDPDRNCVCHANDLPPGVVVENMLSLCHYACLMPLCIPLHSPTLTHTKMQVPLH